MYQTNLKHGSWTLAFCFFRLGCCLTRLARQSKPWIKAQPCSSLISSVSSSSLRRRLLMLRPSKACTSLTCSQDQHWETPSTSHKHAPLGRGEHGVPAVERGSVPYGGRVYPWGRGEHKSKGLAYCYGFACRKDAQLIL